MSLPTDSDREVIRIRTVLFEREREIRELNHRMANSLQLAATYLLWQRRRIEDVAAQEALANTAARISAIGRLHRYLYSHDLDAEVDLKEFLEAFCPHVVASTGLRCVVDAASAAVSGETAQRLGIIINEFAMNAAKHGYAPGQSGTLHVQGRPRGEQLQLVVFDDGKGLGDDFDIAAETGLGMTIVRTTVTQLGGTLRVEDADGARFTILIPLA